MTGRTQTILAGAAVAVVLLAFSFFFIRARQGELGQVREEVQTERDRTQQLETELARLDALRDDAPQLQAALDEMRALVPENNEVPNFVFKVQEAANASGVGFVHITPELPKQPPEGAPLAEVRATVGAKGGYFAVQDFIRRLYDLDRAVRIDGLTLTGVEDDEVAAEDGRIEVNLTARIFFELPPGAEAATTTTPTAGTTPATSAPAQPAPAS